MTKVYLKFTSEDDSPRWVTTRVALTIDGLRAKRRTRRAKKSAGPASFRQHIQEFASELDRLLETFPRAIDALRDSAARQFDESTRKIVAKHGKPVEGRRKDVFEIEHNHLEVLTFAVTRQTDLLMFSVDAAKYYLLGLVSTYDGYLSKLIANLFTSMPSLMSASEKMISVKEAMELGSIDLLKEYVVEREVESILRESHSSHFDWLEQRLGIKLRTDLSIWPKFIEICERRNLLTHTGGKVSAQYLSTCKKHNCEVGAVKRGDTLNVSRVYLEKSIDTFYEIGVKLGYVIWRKSMPKDTSECDSSLNEVCFNLLKSGRYDMAVNMLNFALSMPRISSEHTRRVFVVNRANAYRLKGDPTEAARILDSEDWSATGQQFQISVAAVRGETDRVISLMHEIGANGVVDRIDYAEWPVFKGTRELPAFRVAFEKIFGEPIEIDTLSK